MSTMPDQQFAASHAAEYLAKQIGDARDYSRKLADLRRGRGSYQLPFHRDGAGRAFYYKTHLDEFVAHELGRARARKPIKKVERHDGHLGAILPPSKVIALVV